MPPGRRRFILTSEERKAIRRQKIRSYVQAHRQRKRERQAIQSREQGESKAAASEETTAPAVSLSDSFEAFSEFDPVKDIFPIPPPTLNDDPKFPINLPFKIEFGPETANVFLAVFPGGTSPSGSSENSTRQIRVAFYFSYWATRFSYDADAAESQLLNDAVVGLALNYIGANQNDSDVSVRALDLQTKSLRKLRDGFDAYLQDEDHSNLHLISATALVFAASELLVNKSWPNFSQHLSGVGALIEHAGPSSLSNIPTQDYLFGFRSIYIVISLMSRRASFLARPEWCYFPGRSEHKLGNHPLHTLLDIAYQIPVHLEAFDNAQERPLSWLKSEMQDLIKIESQLDLWSSMLPETYAQSHFAKTRSVWEGLHSDCIEFCNPQAAVCFTLFAGLKVTVENLLVRIIEELKKHERSPDRALRDKIKESFHWSRTVCQCIEYFFASERLIPGKGFALCSFTAAWENFTRLSRNHGMNMDVELSWCRQSANRLKGFEHDILGRWMLVNQAEYIVGQV